ncbi:MAG TPA: polyphosphate kinase 1 [Acidobacteriaceae bacterium]|nr:polyphosphate kinase 1 [Acidobacteriaceae bacterium]
METSVLASIGDHGVLNSQLSPELSEVWIDRDLSWLDFNERVLAEALDERTPLLERAKFLAIFTSNLDEFFMKRVAVLREGQTEAQCALFRELREKLLPMLRRQAQCYRQVLIPELAARGIHLRRWDELTDAQRNEASVYFDQHVSAALTPLVIDPEHPFPFLSNLSTSLAFQLYDPERDEHMVARMKIPVGLKQWVSLSADRMPGQTLLTPLYEVIRGNVEKLYGGMQISGMSLVRTTRDAEVDLGEESAAEIRALVREQIRQRRYEPVVRLEFGPGADPGIREMLRGRFHLSAEDVYDLDEEVDYTTLFEIAGLPIAELHDKPWTPLVPPILEERSIFQAIQAGDILVHHPYESFDATVEHFISAAADDPATVAIKMTAYRIGDDTPFVKSLIRAAEQGKQVACVMEIKARFDEERNLHWAAELERVGAHVTFGVSGLKTHAKTALVVRKESGGLRSYIHIGTGNYHVKTARLYADLGLLTCDPQLTQDVVNLFHYLTGHAHAPACVSLLVAPSTMRPKLLDLIHHETENQRLGRPARIIAKMNQLEDPDIITALCEASAAGVPIDLIIRGFCCLRPGVAGRTDTVRVRSIIGRFLEHSRIFHFANGKENPAEGEFFIGSADWMYRNLSKRIEVVTPVKSQAAKQKLWQVLEICLRDRRQAWTLDVEGRYTQLRPEGDGNNKPENIGTQEALMHLAAENYKN